MKKNQCDPSKRLFYVFVFLSLFGLSSRILAATPTNGDLTITILKANPSSFSAGKIDYQLTISNIGTAAVSSHEVQIYLSTDQVYSSSDQYLGKKTIAGLEAGQQKVISQSARLPWLAQYGSYYLIAYVDFEKSIEESNENNNIASFPILVLDPTVPDECKTLLASGPLLCVENLSDDSYNIYTHGDTPSLINIDPSGQVNTVVPYDLMVPDQVIVMGDQLIKQSETGSIVWQKTIPQGIFTTHPKIDVATELSDGTIVLAGLSKHAAPWPVFQHDSIYLIKTDADLNVEKIVLAMERAPADPDLSIAKDTIYQLLPRADGGLTIVSGIVPAWSVLSHPALSIWHFSKELEDIEHLDNIHTFELKSLIQGPCGTSLITVQENLWSVQGSYNGAAMLWVDLDNLSLDNSLKFGDGVVDFFGSFLQRYFTGNGENELEAGVVQASTASPVTEMEVNLMNDNDFQVPFFPFVYALKTGEDSALLLEQVNEELYLIDVNCTDISHCALATQISNLNCLDNGTSNDPNDDLWTFSLQVDHPLSLAPWSVNDSLGFLGQYGETYTFGPYPIAEGIQLLEVSDKQNIICSKSLRLLPPSTCSACNNSILLNPDLEDHPDIHEAWSASGYTFMSDDAYSGQLAAAIGGKLKGSLHQAWAAMEGKTYTLSVFAKKEGWIGNADYISLKFIGSQGPQSHIKYIQKSNYEKITIEAIAPLGTTAVEVGVFKNKNNSTVTVDNWCLKVSE
ncbi:MAG: CARDB domain-containing protein [Bacteroidota bacterium]